jgi:hypothetical protein
MASAGFRMSGTCFGLPGFSGDCPEGTLSLVLIIFVVASESLAVTGPVSQRVGACLAVAKEARAFRCDSARVVVLVVAVLIGCPQGRRRGRGGRRVGSADPGRGDR